VLGTTGVAHRLGRWIGRPVVQGVVLGLGMGLMLQGAKLMSSQWLLGGAGLLLVVVLAGHRRFPAIFALLLLGLSWSALQQPELYARLGELRLQWHAPSWSWFDISRSELLIGTLFLALPQLPLTLGNAVIAVKEENNRLFPDRPVTERQVAISTGVMNLYGSAVGGVPMCHGAGGLAGHVAFGARTGGALVILGGLLLLLALGLGNSAVLLFELLPRAVLGTILFMTGVQLAAGLFDQTRAGAASTVMLVTAGLSLWNVAFGFVAGVVLQQVLARKATPPSV
jgi:MFS superfamily sulfate permease-like transporter